MHCHMRCGACALHACQAFGSANLVMLKLEDFETTDETGSFVKKGQALHDLKKFLLGNLDVCGRVFKYLSHKVRIAS